MQLKDEDEEMEQYLRRFQPRAIVPLRVSPQPGTAWLLRLAVAAIVLAGGIALWYAPRKTSKSENSVAIREMEGGVLPTSRVNTLALTELALNDSKAFDRVLTEQSRTMFPSMKTKESALQALAKE